MTNADRYISTLSRATAWIATTGMTAGRQATRDGGYPGHGRKVSATDPCPRCVRGAAHHVLSLPDHVLSALAAAMRADRSVW